MARLFTLGRFELVEDAAAAGMAGDLPLPMQPKRLALLTYFAVADAGTFHRRDTLLALFWPELGQEEARRALRQALHHLRRHVGETSLVTRSDDQVGLRAGEIWCDAVELDRAIQDGRDADALAMYRGPFLAGVHLSEVATEFEEWVSRTRVRVQRAVVQAAWRVAAQAELEGDEAAAISAAYLGHSLAPEDEAGLQRLVRLLARTGDRAGALAAYDTFARRLAHDYGTAPSAATEAIVEDIRASALQGVSRAKPNVRVAGPVAALHTGATTRVRLRRWRLAGIATVALTLVTGLVGIARLAFGTDASTPVLAVGWLDNQAGDSAETTVTALRGLIATDLARVEELSVISQSRLLELLGQLGRTENAPGALGAAARLAGATELLEGTLYRRSGGLRLEVRRVELERGVVRAVYVVEDPDPYALVERLTVQLAEAFGSQRPAVPLAASGTGSFAARALYEQGLRSYYRGEWQHAYDHLRAALAADSTFAMAAYYAARAGEFIVLPEERHPLHELAGRLAASAPLRDRLTIRLSGIHGYRTTLALAESMATRFPNEPSGLLALANLRASAGDWLGVIPLARRVAVMDSLSLQGRTEMCRACEAYELMIGSYQHLDSIEKAELVSRDYARWRPASPRAWNSRFASFMILGREKETLVALDRMVQLMPDADMFNRVRAVIRFDRPREAERLLRDRLERTPRDGEALWWLLSVLRHQGRLSDASEVLDQLAQMEATVGPTVWLRAQVHFEKGEFLRAAALFESSAHAVPGATRMFPGLVERHQTWAHTHAAASWIAAGDTTRVSRLVDTMAAVAPGSSYGRDWRLPDHVRGLLSLARGEPDKAVDELRKAVFSASHGYSRTYLELARALLLSDRANEAIPVLQAALRGPNESSGTYATRPEFHELLGRAFQVTGQRDSAAAHYRFVIDYWTDGDPPFRARADSARRWLRALQR